MFRYELEFAGNFDSKKEGKLPGLGGVPATVGAKKPG